MRLVPLLALASFSALAQTAVTQSSPVPGNVQGTVVLQAPNAASCPVAFEARHAQQGGVVTVAPRSRHPEQSYRLTFLPGTGRGITQARVTLHGLAGSRVMPAAQRPGGDSTESFNVSPSQADNHGFHSTIFTTKLTGVQWIELNELTYADGTTWHESASATCHIVPDGFMLVAEGK